MFKKYRSQLLKAIKKEYSFFPSLGLVSKVNSGSHNDMNYKTFKKSFTIFKPYLIEIESSIDKINSFNDLKTIGYNFENQMFIKTNNVNTHKGLIFCIGIFYYCFLIHKINQVDLKTTIIDFCQPLKKLQLNSNSYKLTKRYNLKHAIDNAIDGYQVVFESYSFFKNLNNNYKLLALLLYISKKIDDTTLIQKIGYEKYLLVKEDFNYLLNNILEKKLSKKEILKINQNYILQNISPGGAADLLVLVLFLKNINY
ncbi:triphosphoribosyl-dephospho-CoA synthase [Spiroplasma culicicola]|uniref:triphosphoribosyl-dephospho-CoA synthase n=1 Tax=Spiroplasma culicicola AES-1 TaxID=1276246 RepID=W6AFN6_9MOLU|nr:triphosphoribosyl-dephospho-CoA synthase [Spiroplasma culicicola]AHI52514.1 triphosphoribosyl-dephospho-CoA synthase [Spiroplasma culicicola AES-1]